jgi:hypothetical protein
MHFFMSGYVGAGKQLSASGEEVKSDPQEVPRTCPGPTAGRMHPLVTQRYWVSTTAPGTSTGDLTYKKTQPTRTLP